MGIGRGSAGPAHVIIASFMAIGLVAVPAALAAGHGNPTGMQKLAGGPDLNISAGILNESAVPVQFRPTPAPVRIFELEVGGPTMPGPRVHGLWPGAHRYIR